MSGEAGRSLADKLNHLFATITPGPGQVYSNEHVANVIGQNSDVTISQTYIWQLRKGQKTNPTLRHLQALADYFGVPAAYFFDDAAADRIDGRLAEMAAEQDRVREAMGHGDVRLMAMRAGELSPEGRAQVMGLLDVVYRLEQAERRSAMKDA